jgi:hypothetical protein
MPAGVMRHDTQTARWLRILPGARMPHKAFFICMANAGRREKRYQRRKERRETSKQARLGVYDDFTRVADTDNLYKSFRKAMKGVAWKESVQRYEINALRNVIDTKRKLLAGETIHLGFVEFDIRERGKLRHIKSDHIIKRVVDKCLCENAVVPLLSNTLIYDNGGSIKGKGVHFALRRLVTHLSRYYRGNGRSNEGYALVVDFSKFFDSINHGILFQLQNRIIKDPRIRQLIQSYIAVFGDGVSLGLGSQISQISAIFYPSVLDHYIKERLRIKYYGRYMDDLYLIHRDKEYLKKCLKEIERICGILKIKINEKKTGIVKLSQGLNFLKGKYRLMPSGKVLRLPASDSAKRMKRKLRKFKKLIDSGEMSYEDLRCSYQSWRGNFRRRFNAFHQMHFADKLYFDLFIAERGKNEKYKFFDKDYITPAEYKKRTGLNYNGDVYILDSDDSGCQFWTKAKYGEVKNLSLPVVCALKPRKPRKNWRPV